MKPVFLAVTLLISLQSYSQYAFELNGTTPPALNNHKLIFGIWDRYSLHRFEKVDTILIRNNRFSVKGFLTKPSEEAYLFLMEGPSQKYFVVDSGKNTMIIHEIPPNSVTKKNKLSATEVLNSKANVINKEIERIYYEDHLEEQRNKNRESDSMATERLKRRTRKQFELVLQFPDTYYSLIYLYMLSGRRSLSLDTLLGAYNSLNDNIKGSHLGKELKEKLLNYYALEAGNAIKSFSAFTPAGETFSNTLLKDTVYLLAFGATWCGPCKENIPMLKELYHKFRDKNFRVLYVNLDGNEPLWKKQIADYGVDWINVSDNKKMIESELKKSFNISAIPLYFVIDRDQKIVYNSKSRSLQNPAPEEIDTIIARLLE